MSDTRLRFDYAEKRVPLSAEEAICFSQLDRRMPIINPTRLNNRVEQKKRNGEPLEIVTFACMPKIMPTRTNARVLNIPNISPDARTTIEIYATQLQQFLIQLESRLGMKVNNTIILGDTESRLRAAYAQIPYGYLGSERVMTAAERAALEEDMALRFQRKFGPDQKVLRTSEIIPTEFYKERQRWKKYFSYFLERNTSRKFILRRLSNLDVYAALRINDLDMPIRVVRELAASDAQYAIEGAFLTKNGVDAICIIDTLPQFQAQKHIVGSGKDMTYFFPLAKNE